MKKLYRSESNKMIAGICGGLGELFQVDPTILRLIIAFVGIITGFIPLVIVYIIGWMIIPTSSTIKE